jgi:peptidoglycan LD-endopeptidase LytH
MKAIVLLITLLLGLVSTVLPAHVRAEETKQTHDALLMIYRRVSKITNIPWFYLASVNQYETALHWKKKKHIPGETGIIWKPEVWCGILNPNQADRNAGTICLYGGIGRDGSGDGIADPKNALDSIYTLGKYLSRNGTSEDDIRIALWDYYQDPLIVERVCAFARLFNEYGIVDMSKHSFPLPKRADYSYKDSWGAKRAWGGRRSHEGTDIFACYGTPVLATSYGYVEMIGWNKYGGWRVGIRDLDNIYHYYAHLSSFRKGIQRGTLVKPGQIIGYVGSSGYGKPGTSGKFPPHLHYGMYRDTGSNEWAFDPYPFLRRWEQQSQPRIGG